MLFIIGVARSCANAINARTYSICLAPFSRAITASKYELDCTIPLTLNVTKSGACTHQSAIQFADD